MPLFIKATTYKCKTLLIVIINKMSARRQPIYPLRSLLSLDGESVMEDGFGKTQFYDMSFHVSYTQFVSNLDDGIIPLVSMVGPPNPVGSIKQHILFKRIEFTYSLETASVNSTRQTIRVILVYDRQYSGVLNHFVYEFLDFNGGNPPTVLTPLSVNNSKRYLCLMDRVHDLNAYGQPGSKKRFSFVSNVSLPYSPNTALTGTRSGGLYLIRYGSNPRDGTDCTMKYRVTVYSNFLKSE